MQPIPSFLPIWRRIQASYVSMSRKFVYPKRKVSQLRSATDHLIPNPDHDQGTVLRVPSCWNPCNDEEFNVVVPWNGDRDFESLANLINLLNRSVIGTHELKLPTLFCGFKRKVCKFAVSCSDLNCFQEVICEVAISLVHGSSVPYNTA